MTHAITRGNSVPHRFHLRCRLIAPIAMRLLLCVALFAVLTGCLVERSFPMKPERLVRLSPKAAPVPARDWAARMHTAARAALPPKSQEALTTGDLATSAGIVNVWQH